MSFSPDKRALTGWIIYDFANSAFATSVLAVIFNRYFAEVVAGGEQGTTFNIPFGALTLPGATVWGFLVAFSTLLVALSAPLLGAIADYASLRKRMLVVYCYLGAGATMALALVDAGEVWLGAGFFILANFGFAGGNVFYNAFLLEVSRRESFGRISGIAWGVGYIGGGLCLVVNLIMLKYPQLIGLAEGTFDVGDCMLVAGLWWGVFAIPTVLWIKERSSRRDVIAVRRMTREGWRRLFGTIKELKRYRQLLNFLIAYLIFNDGIETIIIMASIFGAEVVGLNTQELIVYFIMIQGTAFAGSFFFGWLVDRIGNKSTLLITLAVWTLIVIWAYKLGWLLNPRTEYYLLGVMAGLVMGGSQSAARALQASFTPKARSAEFFGFYSISGRFSSIFGPIIFGAAIWLTGGIQAGILAVGVFFIIGGAILFTVDETEGVRTAENYLEG